MKPDRPAERMMAVNAMAGLTATERSVLVAIAYHDGPGGAHPTAATLGKECGGLAGRTVRGHIAKMVERGVLTKHKGQRGDRYSINYDWCLDRPATGQSKNLRRGAQTGRKSDARPADDRPVNRNEPELGTVSGGTVSSPPQIPSPPSTPTPSTKSVAAREGEPTEPDPEAPAWRLPLVRTIDGGRADTPKEGQQGEGGRADLESMVERLGASLPTDDPPWQARGGMQAQRLDAVLASLGKTMLSTPRDDLEEPAHPPGDPCSADLGRSLDRHGNVRARRRAVSAPGVT